MAQGSVVYLKTAEEESNFSKIFEIILQEIRDKANVTEQQIADSIKYTKECFKSYEFPNMGIWRNVCAYLFLYGSLNAGLTRDKVLEAVKTSGDLKSCLQKTDLSIVSLGGGPGNDIIGFCSALFECVEKSQPVDKLRNLDITVVDKCGSWSICVTILKELLLKGGFGNVTELLHFYDVKMSFLQVNMITVADNDYVHSLQKADVILMVKAIFSMGTRYINWLAQTLMNTMKDDALLLYIDAPIHEKFTRHFEVLFQSNSGGYYMCGGIQKMFNSSTAISSKAEIAVLRKSSSPPVKPIRIEPL